MCNDGEQFLENRSKYIITKNSGAFAQCEILYQVSVPRFKFVGEDSKVDVETKVLPFCMVMSQDCDLERDFEQYKKNKSSVLRHILLCELLDSEEEFLRAMNNCKPRDLPAKLTSNLAPRYGFLEKSTENAPELLADFRLNIWYAARFFVPSGRK